MWRPNWLYEVIHELGSIQSSNEKGTPERLYKTEGFYRHRVGLRR